jgi:hypothetical protein
VPCSKLVFQAGLREGAAVLSTRVASSFVIRLPVLPAGFSDAACAYLLFQLATYPLPDNVGGPQAEAPAHGGCRTTLECLKLGPPADRPLFGKEAGKLRAAMAANVTFQCTALLLLLLLILALTNFCLNCSRVLGHGA